jgi:dihydrofolate synthase/folylpolyglutamate synthase
MSVDRLTAWLDSAPNREASGDFAGMKLEPVRRVLERLPAPAAPCIVAGTKGKGSTVRLIEAALVAAGHPVIAFTSPHITSVLERWRIDGQMIEADLAWSLAQQVAAAESAAGIQLTWFERTFAMACLISASRPAAVFICEVGIGGRLDCVNALDARLAIITHLSHDHRALLGPTLHHIAHEKLAIARPGRPLLIAPQTPAGAMAVWRNLANADVRWIQPPRTPVALALAGAHQQDNAATALAAARLLVPGLDESAAHHGLAEATLAARCQLIADGGRSVLIDGAHNRESIAATLAVARDRLRPGFHVILGVASDKEIDEILSVIPPGLTVHRCGYASSRARQAADWPAPADRWSWSDRIGDAVTLVDGTADVCITGSFYLAGEALDSIASTSTGPLSPIRP